MSIYAGIGLSKEKDTALAAQEALRLARQDLGKNHPNLALVFTSGEISAPGFLKIIRSFLPQTPVLGCTGQAVMAKDTISKNAVAIALISFPEDIYFNSACISHAAQENMRNTGDELGKALLYAFSEVRRTLSIIFSEGAMKDDPNFLAQLQERLGVIFPLIEVVASENISHKKSHVYFNQNILSNSSCGILFGGKLNFGLSTKHGWKALGKPRYVTKASGNLLYEINGQPAVKVYEEYMSTNLIKLKPDLKRLSVLYPIGIHSSIDKEYLLRNVRAIQEDGSLLLCGNIAEGDLIKLMISTKESCLEAAKEAAKEAKKALRSQKPELILVFDSAYRQILLGRLVAKELDIIKEVFGKDAPLLGVYAYGESAPITTSHYYSKLHFHSQNITVLALESLAKQQFTPEKNI